MELLGLLFLGVPISIVVLYVLLKVREYDTN